MKQFNHYLKLILGALILVVGSFEVSAQRSTLCDSVVMTKKVSNMDASFSVNPPKNNVKVVWQFGDGQSATGTNVKHTYKKAGNYGVCAMLYEYNRNQIVDSCAVCEKVTVTNNNNSDPCKNFEIGFHYVIKNGLLTMEAKTQDATINLDWIVNGKKSGSGFKNIWQYGPNTDSIEVCLSAFKKDPKTQKFCTSNVCKWVVIPRDSCNLSADFDVEVKGRAIVAEAKTNLKNVKYIWDFGDKSSSKGRVGKHTYKYNDQYTICLRVISIPNNNNTKACTTTVCKMVKVGGNECDFKAEYSYKVDGNKVLYSAWSNDSNARFIWDFGDNTSGKGARADHKYKRSGAYKVCLTAIVQDPNSQRACTTTVCKEVRVGKNNNDSCNLKVKYDYVVKDSLIVFEASPVLKAGNYEWVVNGKTVGKGPRWVTSLPKGKKYNVCVRLTISNRNAKCKAVYCKLVDLTKKCGIQADFSFKDNDSLFAFEGKSNAKDGEYYWMIDNQERLIKGRKMTHEFKGPGRHIVCLIVKSKTFDCETRVCKVVYVKDSCDRMKIAFNAIAYQTTVGFFAKTNNKNAQVLWYFGDGKQGRGTQVKHQYAKPGTYRVCAIAYDSISQCKTYYCTVITVSNRYKTRYNPSTPRSKNNTHNNRRGPEVNPQLEDEFDDFSMEDVDAPLNIDWSVSVTPNPATSFINVNATEDITQLEVMDLNGKVIVRVDAPQNGQQISVQDLPQGIYLIRAQNVMGAYKHSKFIVRQ